MNRFWRVNTIWRKELKDILRDRRTVIAMVLVPIVLYPAMMLGSLQAFEIQDSRLNQERYRLVVSRAEERDWVLQQVQRDEARREASRRAAASPTSQPAQTLPRSAPPRRGLRSADSRADLFSNPVQFDIAVVPNVEEMVRTGRASVGLLFQGELPTPQTSGAALVLMVRDETDPRSQKASTSLDGILRRAGETIATQRLERIRVNPQFVQPVQLAERSVATAEKRGGSVLGTVVPLILILMTLTGAIYPAIDLTAGERERGTLETLMVAPVPTVELIAGKFVVVTMIAMLSAMLNLLSIGGTIYLGGLGDLLTGGRDVVISLTALPLVMLVLMPLSLLFSAMLLAVCSFARSFKEAQNYVVPVMMAALIPATVGILPGTRLEGAMLLVPVANIVILTRELFLGNFPIDGFIWTMLSTTVYAGAAVAVAARLFGQEAVLFADSASLRTIFQRRHFKPRMVPSAAQALLTLGLIFPAMYYAQLTISQTEGVVGSVRYFYALMFLMIALFVLTPCLAALYCRVDVPRALAIDRGAPPRAWAAALCFGLSTWILAQGWISYQHTYLLPFPVEMLEAIQQQLGWMTQLHWTAAVFFMAVTPAVCEELFFRGFLLSGLRAGLGAAGAALAVGVAFGVCHYSAHRLVVTAALGVLLAVLVLQYRSIWPAMLVHFMHNALPILSESLAPMKEFVRRIGLRETEPSLSDPFPLPGLGWLAIAAGLLLLGMVIAIRPRAAEPEAEFSPRALPARA